MSDTGSSEVTESETHLFLFLSNCEFHIILSLLARLFVKTYVTGLKSSWQAGINALEEEEQALNALNLHDDS
ncbi:unnamed protein product [Schistosoma intercalatum]|nr:unnamed protein product [Schistosoma intercalatum]